MKKTSYLIFLILIACVNAFSQNGGIISKTSNGQSLDFIPVSPNAGGLGTYGQVPVSLYTGTPNINIPLYNVSYKELNIPIGISYNASGNKPDDVPGSVGLNWSMDAPWVINRVVNGRVDEGGDIPDSNDPTVLNNLAPLTSDDNWSSQTYLSNLLSHNVMDNKDGANPDTYYFNFNGFSGRFYFDHLGACHIRSQSGGTLKIEKEVQSNKQFDVLALDQNSYTPPANMLQSYLLWMQNGVRAPYAANFIKAEVVYKFTVTDGNGIKYIFGGVNEAIEFSRPAFSVGEGFHKATGNYINSTSWYITSVESPNGYKISLDYTRGLVVTKSAFSNITKMTWPNHTWTTPLQIVNGEKSTMINTSILHKITTPKEEITFNSSAASAQLDYDYPTGYYAGFAGVDYSKKNDFFFYDDVYYGPTQHRFPDKIDNIQVLDKLAGLRRNINFNYTSDPATRLKLLSVQILGANGTLEAYPEYKFDYNMLALPPYLSYKIDHYGFYNGRNPYAFLSQTDYLTLSQNLYNASRDADSNYVKAEILNKITYPTGGYTTFEYEPNTYVSYFRTWPFQVDANIFNVELMTGGVRIKKVNSYDGEGLLAGFKKYHYVKNFAQNGNVCSGVKAYQPTYFESYSGTMTTPAHVTNNVFGGSFSYYKFSNNPIYPMGQTRGSHITYSEVTEENADGTLITHKYKNYDNGYGDVAPLTYVADNGGLKDFWKEDEGISMDLERGQVLSEEYFDSNKNLKEKIEYVYNDDPDRFNDYVRVINKNYNSPNDAQVGSLRYNASLIYTYFPYLKQKKRYEYNGNGIAGTVTSYAYNSGYNSLKATTSEASDGSSVKIINRYPPDMYDPGIRDPLLGAYRDMSDQYRVGTIVENEKQVDGIKQQRKITEYDQGLSSNPALILPSTEKVQQQSGPELLKVRYNNYDDQGNILSLSQQNGTTTCYVWAYNKSYPVAKIENANYADVRDVLGGAAAISTFGNLSFPTDEAVNTFLAPLRTDVRLKNAITNTFTCDLLAGVSSSTDAKGMTTYYEYDGFQRLKDIKDHNHNMVKYFCYNYAGQVVDCNLAPPTGPASHVFNFASSQSAACSAPLGTLMIVVAYTASFGTVYYTDMGLTTLLPDGYYVRQVNGNTRQYSYIQNGVITNNYSCTN